MVAGKFAPNKVGWRATGRGQHAANLMEWRVSRRRDLYLESCPGGVKSTFPTVHLVHELRATLDDGFRIFYGSQYGGYCRLPLLDLSSPQRQQLERLLP